MKKLFGLMALLIAAVTFTSCGNDEPDPDDIPIKGVYSTLTDGATNYETTTEKYYKFELWETAKPKYLYIHNVKFDPRMPISITMRIPLDGVEIKQGSGDSSMQTWTIDHPGAITPDLFRGGTWTPYAEREVTNLKLTLTTKTFMVTFTCIGIPFSDEGAIYYMK